MPLYLDLEPGQSFVLTRGNGESTTIKLERKTGSRARVSIEAPEDVAIKQSKREPDLKQPPR